MIILTNVVGLRDSIILICSKWGCEDMEFIFQLMNFYVAIVVNMSLVRAAHSHRPPLFFQINTRDDA